MKTYEQFEYLFIENFFRFTGYGSCVNKKAIQIYII